MSWLINDILHLCQFIPLHTGPLIFLHADQIYLNRVQHLKGSVDEIVANNDLKLQNKSSYTMRLFYSIRVLY